jgi:hypothetical protein
VYISFIKIRQIQQYAQAAINLGVGWGDKELPDLIGEAIPLKERRLLVQEILYAGHCY